MAKDFDTKMKTDMTNEMKAGLKTVARQTGETGRTVASIVRKYIKEGLDRDLRE